LSSFKKKSRSNSELTEGEIPFSFPVVNFLSSVFLLLSLPYEFMSPYVTLHHVTSHYVMSCSCCCQSNNWWFVL